MKSSEPRKAENYDPNKSQDTFTRFALFVQKYQTSGLARIKPTLNC